MVSFCQSKKYTLEEAEKSEDPKVLANFIVNNPNHPKTLVIRQKLAYLIVSKEEKNKTAVSKNIEPKGKENVIGKKSDDTNTTDILNHLLNDNSKSNQAYIVIKNASQCDISVSITGNKMYNLNILAGKLGRLLVDKGNYTIASKICKADYKAHKKISNAMEITLNNAR